MSRYEIIKYLRSKKWRERPNAGRFSLYKTTLTPIGETEFKADFSDRMIHIYVFTGGKWELYRERSYRSVSIINGIIRI
jgi:hypothetical protein